MRKRAWLGLVFCSLVAAMPTVWARAWQPPAGAAGVAAGAGAEDAPALPAEIPLSEGLAIRGVSLTSRTLVRMDAIESLLVKGEFRWPAPGDEVALAPGPDGKARAARWAAVQAGAQGAFAGEAFQGGYLAVRVESPVARVMMLEAAGHSMVYVNGQPRMGDPYSTGAVLVPVALRAGENTLVFASGRGPIRGKLRGVQGSLVVLDVDATTPDVVRGRWDEELLGGVLVANASERWMRVSVEVSWPDKAEPVAGPRLLMPPLSVRKMPVRIVPRAVGASVKEVVLAVLATGISTDAGGQIEAAGAPGRLSLRVREPGQTYKRTFISEIDGSVQYFAVVPRAGEGDGQKPAMVLSLHGASVEATSQADSYAPKPWGVIVCPTNRRPFGFDWEDWGRLDAMEVKRLAAEEFGTDPARTLLTGHSMGGHGTWQLGVLFPGEWAGIGPSAGWCSFETYGGRSERLLPRDDDRADMLRRAHATSETLALLRNVQGVGVSIVHGDADDNVPVSEARRMRDALAEFHGDVYYHEQPGAGHWWDDSPEPGAACVDFPAMMKRFERARTPDARAADQARFVTMDPSVFNRLGWAMVERAERAMVRAGVDLRVDQARNAIVGSAENVRTLVLDLAAPACAGVNSVELDGGGRVGVEPGKVVRLERVGGAWRQADSPPERPRVFRFKSAWDRRFALVIPTGGDAQAREWALAKARFDSEQWWVRGNGACDIYTDRDWLALPDRARAGRNVILYGDARANGAWASLLDGSGLSVEPGRVRLGDRELVGENLAVLCVRDPGGDGPVVGVVAGTGAVGRRLTERLPYFVSGVGVPGVVVLDDSMLSQGIAGVRAAGFSVPGSLPAQGWAGEEWDLVWRATP
jgi:poly(3-hydroxybutyrate) depolymerase